MGYGYAGCGRSNAYAEQDVIVVTAVLIDVMVETTVVVVAGGVTEDVEVEVVVSVVVQNGTKLHIADSMGPRSRLQILKSIT